MKVWSGLFALLLSWCAFNTPAHAIVKEEMESLTSGICTAELKGLADLAKKDYDRAVFLEKFLAPIAAIEPYVTTNLKAKEIARNLLKANKRGDAFAIETLLKFYKPQFKNTPYEEDFNKLFDDYKGLEDALGFAGDSANLPLDLKAMGADDRAVAWAQKQADKKFDALVDFLKDRHWLGEDSKRLRKAVELFQKIKTPTQIEDTRYLDRVINEHIHRILITDWDMTDLENQLHELRRLLRMLSILKSAERGKMLTLKAPPNESIWKFEKFRVVPDKLKPFQLYKPSAFRVDAPIYFYEASENAMTIEIEILGKLKDRGEEYVLSMEALVKSGSFGTDKKRAKKLADAWLRPKLEAKGWKPYLADALNEYRDFRDSKMLENLLATQPEVTQPE